MTEIPEHLLKRAQEAATRRRRPAEPAAPPRPAAPAGERPPRAASPRTCSSDPRRPRPRRPAAPTPTPAWRRRGRRRPVAARSPPLALPARAGPGGHTQRLLTVVKSGSIQDVKAKPQDKVTRVAAPAHHRVRRGAVLHRLHADLLDLRERAAPRAGRHQPDAQPVEGAVVLPRSAGTAHHVPPDGGRRDHPGHGHLLA
jgi:hypothetical protein